MPLSSVFFQGAGHHKLFTDCCSWVPPMAPSLPSWLHVVHLFHGTVEHVDKCLPSLSKEEASSGAKKWLSHRHLSPPEAYHSICLKKLKPGTVKHLLCFGSHHLMLICICRYLNAFEKGTFSAFWWTSQYEDVSHFKYCQVLHGACSSLLQVTYSGACMGG